MTWIDYLAGQIITELEVLGHKDDTVIALVGDHGWQLGEHNICEFMGYQPRNGDLSTAFSRREFVEHENRVVNKAYCALPLRYTGGKHTNFELGTRVPLIFHAVGQTEWIKSNALVESVDIYPTLAALAGLDAPSDVDGTALTTLWKNPNATISEAVFSEYPRCAPVGAAWTPEPGHNTPQSCVNTPRSNFTVMGYSVRTENWRCTLWMPWIGEKLAADFEAGPVAVELYSHNGDNEVDFDQFENENVATAHPSVVAAHLAIAKKQWEKLYE